MGQSVSLTPWGALLTRAGFSQVGIGADCGASVGGDGNIRNDADVARRRKVDEVANVGVRVETLGRVCWR